MEIVKEYIRIQVDVRDDEAKGNNIFISFRDRMDKYRIGDIKDRSALYRIPSETDDYAHAHEYVNEYGSGEDGIVFFEYKKKEILYENEDYDQAVAYIFNFHNIVDTYDDLAADDFCGQCCENSIWGIQESIIQSRNVLLPRSKFSAKKFARVDMGYAINDEIAAQLISCDFIEKDDLREIVTKNNSHVCYQISPQKKFKGFMANNGYKLEDRCSSCGTERYSAMGVEEPFYVTCDILKRISGIVRTEEFIGPLIEDGDPTAGSVILEPLYFADKNTYEMLYRIAPRMQFIPVFLKDD